MKELNVDEVLYKFCVDNDFPVEEMDEDDFKKVGDSLFYKHFLLNKSIWDNVCEPIEKRLAQRMKSVKKFRKR